MAMLATVALFRSTELEITPQLIIFLGLLFAACTVLHGELALMKPEPSRLTSFYLTISAGGAFGGIFVGIIAPLVFPAIWEYHIGLFAAALCSAAVLLVQRDSWLFAEKPSPVVPLAFVLMVASVPLYLVHVGATKMELDTQFQCLGALIVGWFIVLVMLFSGGPQWLRRKEF